MQARVIHYTVPSVNITFFSSHDVAARATGRAALGIAYI